MKKLIFYASAFSLLMFTGCSSEDDDILGSGTGNGSSSSLTTVVSSGVKQIPLTVTDGTTEVTVKYTVGGQEQSINVPFTVTSSSANRVSSVVMPL